MFDVSLAMVELSGEVGEQARNKAGAESRPDGQHIILVRGQVDNNDGLLAGGRGSNGWRTEGGHEREGHGPNGGLEPGNVIGLCNSRGSDEGERPISIGLSGPCEQVWKGAQVRWGGSTSERRIGDCNEERKTYGQHAYSQKKRKRT